METDEHKQPEKERHVYKGASLVERLKAQANLYDEAAPFMSRHEAEEALADVGLLREAAERIALLEDHLTEPTS